MNDAYVGTWYITEMELWDKGFINLVAPGNIVIEKDGRGSLSFGAVEVGLDCAIEKTDGKNRIAFSFTKEQWGQPLTRDSRQHEKHCPTRCWTKT